MLLGSDPATWTERRGRPRGRCPRATETETRTRRLDHAPPPKHQAPGGQPCEQSLRRAPGRRRVSARRHARAKRDAEAPRADPSLRTRMHARPTTLLQDDPARARSRCCSPHQVASPGRPQVPDRTRRRVRDGGSGGSQAQTRTTSLAEPGPLGRTSGQPGVREMQGAQDWQVAEDRAEVTRAVPRFLVSHPGSGAMYLAAPGRCPDGCP